MATSNPTLGRLDDQIGWYDRKSLANRRWYIVLSTIEIASAAMVPLAAGAAASPVVTGGLGVLVVLLQGLKHLNQFHQNWIGYRSTCEALKHERFLYLATAGPYARLPDPTPVLAERIESLISHEHAKWVRAREDTSRNPPGSGVGSS